MVGFDIKAETVHFVVVRQLGTCCEEVIGDENNGLFSEPQVKEKNIQLRPVKVVPYHRLRRRNEPKNSQSRGLRKHFEYDWIVVMGPVLMEAIHSGSPSLPQIEQCDIIQFTNLNWRHARKHPTNVVERYMVPTG